MRATWNEKRKPDMMDKKIEPGMANVCKLWKRKQRNKFQNFPKNSSINIPLKSRPKFVVTNGLNGSKLFHLQNVRYKNSSKNCVIVIILVLG